MSEDKNKVIRVGSRKSEVHRNEIWGSRQEIVKFFSNF